MVLTFKKKKYKIEPILNSRHNKNNEGGVLAKYFTAIGENDLSEANELSESPGLRNQKPVFNPQFCHKLLELHSSEPLSFQI